MHKKSKIAKTLGASLLAASMIAPTVAAIAPMSANAACQVLGETSFDYKALPWHTCESSPAKQDFDISNGAFHVEIINAQGADGEKWDLQVRHRNLNFKKGHTYEVSFKVKSNRAGMELCSKIGNIKGDEEYFVLSGSEMQMGPHMGGQWGKALSLTTDYQTVKGTFKPTQDIEAAEWAFHYAQGTKYEGNGKAGDELWFDDMSIVCQDCPETWSEGTCGVDPDNHFGAVSREYSNSADPKMKDGKTLVNYISVNQVGYYPNLQKIAVLGDNAGDIVYGAQSISLSKSSYDFDVCDASSGASVYSGTSGSTFKDPDSGDTVCKLDFTEFNKPGRYYIKVGDWRSMEFNIGDNIYTDDSHNMLTNAINYFYQNRSGLDIEAKYITSGDTGTLAHKGGHKTDKAAVQKIWKNEYASKDEATSTYASSTITANKGWYDAGDHGKYVVNGGIAVWTLQNMYERSLIVDGGDKFADNSGTVVVPETGNKIPDVIDECLYEMDFMTQMVVDSSEPTWGKYAGMVYHKLHDHKWTGLATKPDGYEEEWGTTRIVKPPTFAATLNYAACAAQTARLLEPYDSTKAKFFLEEAKTSYQAYKDNYYEADHSKKTHPDLKCDCEAEEINEKSLYAPMWQAKGGGPYGDNEVKDDGYWAACEIFVTAKALGDSDADKFFEELSAYKDAFKVTTRITGGENKDGSFTTFNWGNTASAGSMTLLMHQDLLSEDQAKTLQDSVVEAADNYIAEETKQGYGIPYKYDGQGYNDPNNLNPSIIINGYEWGSNSMVINNAIVMAYAYDITGDVKYMNGVTTAMDYLLGTNPLSFSFVTGYGTYHEQKPHHRYWSNELDKTLPMAPDGVLSGGPNAGLQDPYVRALGFVSGDASNPSQRCFVDSIEAWSTNEVTINWNAPLAWIVSFLQDEAAQAPAAAKGDKFGGKKTVTDPVTTTTQAPVTTTTSKETTSVVTTTVKNPSAVKADLYGDANCDGKVNMGDVVLIMQSQANPDKFGLNGSDKSHITAQGNANADVYENGSGITNNDALSVQKYLLELIKSLPES
ncbi:MAG: glycoside hydrolase family 9 protein [Ruminococcus sp.]|nr:glycoside hydrolase family 9 protein [Ruminococcus sp.]